MSQQRHFASWANVGLEVDNSKRDFSGRNVERHSLGNLSSEVGASAAAIFQRQHLLSCIFFKVKRVLPCPHPAPQVLGVQRQPHGTLRGTRTQEATQAHIPSLHRVPLPPRSPRQLTPKDDVQALVRRLPGPGGNQPQT